MAEKRVPTQFLDLSSQDFGPRQEEAGSRIQKVGRPPPTALIQIPEQVKREDAVLAELDHKHRSIAEKSRRWARSAIAMCVTTWESARRAALEASRAAREAAGLGNAHSTGRTITLGSDEPLRLRADETSPETMTLVRGATVVLYPQIDAPAGWIAARAPGGELGWVSAERVLSDDGSEEPTNVPIR